MLATPEMVRSSETMRQQQSSTATAAGVGSSRPLPAVPIRQDWPAPPGGATHHLQQQQQQQHGSRSAGACVCCFLVFVWVSVLAHPAWLWTARPLNLWAIICHSACTTLQLPITFLAVQLSACKHTHCTHMCMCCCGNCARL
jgi:hypothetical protein